MINSDEGGGPGQFVKRYTIAFVSVLAAGLVTWACREALGLQLVKTFFFGAVIVAAMSSGLRPGLLAVLLSYVAMSYFFVPPLHSFRVGSDFIVSLIIFVVLASCLAAACAFVREARHFFSE